MYKCDCLTTILHNYNAFPVNLITDSYGLYSTITTLHEGRDYRLRPTVARIRDSFESHELTSIRWIPGKLNISDALTKLNYHMIRTLNNIMIDGELPKDILSYTNSLIHE